MKHHYMIVSAETHRADIFKKIYFYRWDWRDEFEERADRPFTLWFFDDDTDTHVYYREEHKDVFTAKYFYVEGDDPEDTITMLQDTARILTIEELIADFSHEADDLKRGSAIYQLGIAATLEPFSPAIGAVFAAGLRDSAPGVRIATLWGMAWPHWDALAPLVEQALHDSDPGVQRAAAALRKAFEQQP